jgi:hypothetical protein
MYYIHDPSKPDLITCNNCGTQYPSLYFHTCPVTAKDTQLHKLKHELLDTKKNFSILEDALIEISKRYHSQQACAEIADKALAEVKGVKSE